ncbi:MAG TPA: hypothetical protein VII01_15000 [Solirubrobacteraceae bacterium]
MPANRLAPIKLARYVHEQDGCSLAEAAAAVGVSERAAKRYIVDLKRQDYVVTAKGRGGGLRPGEKKPRAPHVDWTGN